MTYPINGMTQGPWHLALLLYQPAMHVAMTLKMIISFTDKKFSLNLTIYVSTYIYEAIDNSYIAIHTT